MVFAKKIFSKRKYLFSNLQSSIQAQCLFFTVHLLVRLCEEIMVGVRYVGCHRFTVGLGLTRIGTIGVIRRFSISKH